MKRLPKQTKILQGTFRPGREKTDAVEVDPLATVPPPPTTLGRHGKAKWKELAPKLVEKGILTPLDLPAFEAMCGCWDLYADSIEIIYGKGRRRKSLSTYISGKSSQEAPATVLAKQMLALFKSYLTEFGLSPSSRGKVSRDTGKKKEVDPMEALLGAQ